MVEAFSNMDAPIGRHIPAKSKQNQLEKNPSSSKKPKIDGIKQNLNNYWIVYES